MSPQYLAEEVRREKQLDQLLVNYNLFYLRHISQGLACNGLHSIRETLLPLAFDHS